MNIIDVKNGENVQFDDDKYGQGKGVIVGIFTDSNNQEYYVIYPKIPRSGYKYSCFLTKRENVILTPY